MSVQEMQIALIRGDKTSVQLTVEALSNAERQQDKNAVAVLSPVALSLAKQRDEERKKGFIRGPLHGIPILIKDNILYADGTPTTANSFALSKFIPKENATIVNLLLNAGAVILGKANLSEFAYFMGGEKMPSGYGSMYGQVKHPLYEGIDPLGSSTGSAVAVALNLTQISIGTETNGSIMAPAFQNQVVGFKPTFGLVSKHGIVPISPTQDTAGPFANTVYDCALLMDILNVEDTKDKDTLLLPRPTSFAETLLQPFVPKRIGLFSIKKTPYESLELQTFNNIKLCLQALGFECVDIEIEEQKLENYPTLLQEFKVSLNQFLMDFKSEGLPSSLESIIDFNDQNADRCLKYGQDILLASQATKGGLVEREFLQRRETLMKEASVLEDLLIQHDLQAIVTPTWMSYAPIFGNPSLCIPEGYVNRNPTGAVFVGKKYDDALLLHLGNFYQTHRK
jgi:amidase